MNTHLEEIVTRLQAQFRPMKIHDLGEYAGRYVLFNFRKERTHLTPAESAHDEMIDAVTRQSP